MTTATQTSLGEIKLAGDLAGSNNGLLPELSSTSVTPGSYTLPVVSIDAKGRITSATNGSNSDIMALIQDATSSVKGIASFNSDFVVTDGNVALNASNLPVATGSAFGVVKSGTNLTNTAGVLSIPDATSSVKGVASFGSDFVVTSGAVSLVTSNFASVSSQNIWTKAQAHAISTLAYASTITPDFSLSNIFSLTTAGNFTLANPTNVTAGTTYVIIVTQGGGNTITWGSNFKFPPTQDTTLTSTAGKRDIISIIALTSTALLTTIQRGF